MIQTGAAKSNRRFNRLFCVRAEAKFGRGVCLFEWKEYETCTDRVKGNDGGIGL
jgi:hypothetical protein